MDDFIDLKSYYNMTTVHSSKKITEVPNYFEYIAVLDHLNEKLTASAVAASFVKD